MRSTQRTVMTDDGVRIRVLEDGRTDAPVLLFVAGFGQGADSFDMQAAELSDEYRVFRFDARGVGGSDKPHNGYRISRFAQDLRNVVDALGCENVVLVAHSMGGAVALSYLELTPRHPLRAFVLVDRPSAMIAVPGVRPSAPFPIDAVFERAREFAGLDRQEAVVEFVRSMARAHCPPNELDLLIEATASVPPDALVQLYLNSRLENWDDFLPTIRIPTLVIAAAESMIPVEAMKDTAERIPGSQFVVLARSGHCSHFMFQDSPAEFNQVIRTFAREAGPARLEGNV